MKRKKFPFHTFFLSCLLFASISFAQNPPKDESIHHKNFSLFIGTAISYLSEPQLITYHQGVLNMPMMGVEKNWGRKWTTRLCYARWDPFTDRLTQPAIIYYGTFNDNLLQRSKYSFIDLAIGYNLLKINSHAMTFFAGPSYTWGMNKYGTRYYGELSNPDLFVGKKKMSYLGISGAINYGYTFWKDRLRAGAFICGRFYPGLKSKQVDLGILLGYHF